ncbi:MAG: hypothetical protein GDA44_09445 [Prochloron sp. SP5CPC1]|nr:hypothetical protein [Candidatus Paraprochloron terpiosi SP5CPC1]
MAGPEVAPKIEHQSHPEIPNKKEKEETMTDSNLARLEQLINAVNDNVNQLKGDVKETTENLKTELKAEIQETSEKLRSELKGEIQETTEKVNDLDKKIIKVDATLTGLEKRLGDSVWVSRASLVAVCTAFFLAVLGGIAKFIFGE